MTDDWLQINNFATNKIVTLGNRHRHTEPHPPTQMLLPGLFFYLFDDIQIRSSAGMATKPKYNAPSHTRQEQHKKKTKNQNVIYYYAPFKW